MVGMSTEFYDPGEPATSRPAASVKRRTIIRGAMGGALVALLAPTGQAMAQAQSTPNDPFILLLKGIYSPVAKGRGPNVGLSSVNLSDGSYWRTRIYPVFGLNVGEDAQQQTQAVGNFFVQLTNNPPPPTLCAYQLPGGAIAMQFTASTTANHDDGMGGTFIRGTYELNVIEATGIFKPFQGGHNHMVDNLHHLANGQFAEFCFCNISEYPFP
jgi:hypothetical protein